MSGGRPKEVGDERYATLSEAADALGVSYNAIYRRVTDSGTIPSEQHIDESGKTVRLIPREWLDAEVARKATPATVDDANERTMDLLQAFEQGVEIVRNEVETQHTQLVPLTEQALENQSEMRENQMRVLGALEEMKTAQGEMYKVVRRSVGRLEEADRREREYQEENLQLQRELRDTQQELTAIFREMKAETEKQRQERERERRSWWRRLFEWMNF